MNPNSFSFLGYLSVLLWLAVPLLWLMRRRIRVPAWLPLLLAVLSLVLATINSRTHVARIEVESNVPIADQLMIEAAKRKAVQKARGADVADIRFAEDGSNDFIDKAGLGDAESKYLKKLEGADEPEWKKQKKTRGTEADEKASLDDTLGGKKVISGVSSEALPSDDAKRPPIMMSEAHQATAFRLNNINLSITRLAILLCILLLVVDYLRNANRYAHASFPLPLPASWRNAFTQLPAIVHRPQPPRRDITQELAWIVRRGEVFVCFTKDATSLPATLPRLGKSKFPVDLLHVDSDRVSDYFVFESLWYGRCCFVVDSPERATRLFISILKLLEERNVVRAQTTRSAHLVWNLDPSLSEQDIANFERLATNTGFSLFVCHENNSH
ncbi:MAG: hypothetical protein WCS43_05190 [Verrucomicrobiota bacterium]